MILDVLRNGFLFENFQDVASNGKTTTPKMGRIMLCSFFNINFQLRLTYLNYPLVPNANWDPVLYLPFATFLGCLSSIIYGKFFKQCIRANLITIKQASFYYFCHLCVPPWLKEHTAESIILHMSHFVLCFSLMLFLLYCLVFLLLHIVEELLNLFCLVLIMRTRVYLNIKPGE